MDKNQLFIIAHSQQMLNCAEQGRWDELAALERRFQPMLNDFFKSIEADTERTQQLSKQLLAQNEVISKLIKREQARILELQSQEHQNAKAMHSYLQDN